VGCWKAATWRRQNNFRRKELDGKEAAIETESFDIVDVEGTIAN
jgi:hypothetical protein